MKEFKLQFKNIDWKTFIVFLIYALTPAIWNLIRAKIITGFMDASLEIFAQWGYVNIGLEMLHEGLVFPLFWWFGLSLKQNNQEEFYKKVKSSYLFTFIIYFLAIFIISFFVSDFIKILGSDEGFEEKLFFELQLWSKLPGTLFFISCIVFISLKKWKEVLILMVAKLIFGIAFDFTFANENIYGYGYSGLGISALLSTLIIFIISLVLVINVIGLKKFFEKQKFKFDKPLIKNISYSMGDSFVRNIFYLLMVASMINSLDGETSSVYWLTNEIIWSWILLPIIMMNHIQKGAIANYKGNKVEQLKLSIIFTLINYLIFIFTSLLFFLIWNPLVLFMTSNDWEKVYESKHIFKIIIGFYLFFITSETITF